MQREEKPVVTVTVDPSDYMRVPLYDLGTEKSEWAGIFAPEPERGLEKVGISEQFLADAAYYHQRYADTQNHVAHFKRILKKINFDTAAGLEILDVGAGSGANSILPCAEVFPSCRIIATDLSPNLLRILHDYVTKEGIGARVACICTDGMNNFFAAERFDVVVGVAILHHLIDPQYAIRAAYVALRPGGVALFFEPFASGHLILCATFKQILKLQTALGPIDRVGETVLRAMVLDWSTRAKLVAGSPLLPHLDDKWMFTREYFDLSAEVVGFERPTIIDMTDPGEVYESFALITRKILRLHSGLQPSALTDWAWALIDQLDETFTEEVRREIILSGIIALQKPRGRA